MLFGLGVKIPRSNLENQHFSLQPLPLLFCENVIHIYKVMLVFVSYKDQTLVQVENEEVEEQHVKHECQRNECLPQALVVWSLVVMSISNIFYLLRDVHFVSPALKRHPDECQHCTGHIIEVIVIPDPHSTIVDAVILCHYFYFIFRKPQVARYVLLKWCQLAMPEVSFENVDKDDRED